MSEDPKVFWRFFDYSCGTNVYVTQEKFALIRETKLGYWIRTSSLTERWISKTSRKRYAYPTREEAWVSFMARKKRQVMWAARSLSRAQAAARIQKMPEEPVINAGSFGTLGLSCWDA